MNLLLRLSWKTVLLQSVYYSQEEKKIKWITNMSGSNQSCEDIIFIAQEKLVFVCLFYIKCETTCYIGCGVQ